MTNEQQRDDDRKLHIDSDWKERARVEKENLAAQTAARKAAAASAAADEKIPTLSRPLPPDWVRGLIGHLSNLAVISLGLEPTPGASMAAPRRDLEHARFAIDMLEQFQKRSSGGLDPEEAAVLEDALYQLRMIFVQVTEAASAGGSAPAAGSKGGASAGAAAAGKERPRPAAARPSTRPPA